MNLPRPGDRNDDPLEQPPLRVLASKVGKEVVRGRMGTLYMTVAGTNLPVALAMYSLDPRQVVPIIVMAVIGFFHW